jgi:Plavaka transposase
VKKFKWDAQHLYKYNGSAFIRFIHEPWTADRWWTIQVSTDVSLTQNPFLYQIVKSSLPEGAKPLCFIIYADKTRLSSFGTTKGYPVIARCGNLPINVRNGKGVGGGRIVGWLPIVGNNTATF